MGLDTNILIYGVLSLAGVGLALGIILGIASKVFAVEEDERIPILVAALPGANCGGCGFAGCAAFANGLVKGAAKTNGCPVGGEPTAIKVAEILGVEAEIGNKMVAYVRCAGDCEKANRRYEYTGYKDCFAEAQMADGGSKTCTYGCLGSGTCVSVCGFDAIDIVNGVAVINEDKCTSCGACVSACPKSLIEIVPAKQHVRVACNSKDLGKVVNTACGVGCIACRICEKNCPHDAIHVNANVAHVDYDKCTMCNVCFEKCPKNTIHSKTFTKAPKEAPKTA